MNIKEKIADPLGIKARRNAFTQALKSAHDFKLAEYARIGRDEEPLRLTVTVGADDKAPAAFRSQDSKASDKHHNTKLPSIERLEKSVQEIKASADKCQSLLSEALSPEIFTKARDTLLSGSILTREGRLMKLAALKDIGLSMTSPLFILHLSTLILESGGEQEVMLSELKKISSGVEKLALDKELSDLAAIEDAADRLRFYVTCEGALTEFDRDAEAQLERYLSREVLKCAHYLEHIKLETPKSALRDLSHAKAAAALAAPEFFKRLSYTCLVSFFYVISVLTVKRDLNLAYSSSWDLEEKILSPMGELLAFVHAEILCRLKMLEDTVKLNPFDRSKLTKLREGIEEQFLAVQERYLSLLRFYRRRTELNVRFADVQIQEPLLVHEDAP